MKCLNLHSADTAQDHSLALDIPLQTQGKKANTGQKSLSFLGPKIWSKIGPSIKNVRTSTSFMHAIKKNILLHLRN